MKIYRSAFLLPLDIQIPTIRHFFCFGVLVVKKKSFIFAASSDLVKNGQKALTANVRFCATAAGSPQQGQCEIESL
jgi:hypothetical protein